MPLIHDKVPLVLFSGGLDSTLVLMEALREFAKVDVCSVSLSGQDEKTKRETAAQAAIIKVLAAMHKKDSAGIGEIRFRTESVGVGMRQASCLGFGQSPMWMAAAYNCVTPETCDLRVGYLNSDNQAPLYADTVRAWDAMLDASGFRILNQKKPPLFAPYIFHNKERALLGSLGVGNATVMKHVSWCESHSPGTDCGTCPSCLEMMKAIIGLRVLEPDYYAGLAFKGRFLKMMSRHTASKTIKREPTIRMKSK